MPGDRDILIMYGKQHAHYDDADSPSLPRRSAYQDDPYGDTAFSASTARWESFRQFVLNGNEKDQTNRFAGVLSDDDYIWLGACPNCTRRHLSADGRSGHDRSCVSNPSNHEIETSAVELLTIACEEVDRHGDGIDALVVYRAAIDLAIETLQEKQFDAADCEPGDTITPAPYGRRFEHDNRWSPGASDDNQVGSPDPPTDALAMYSGRWIDRGFGMAADILPDRQGFAYDTVASRDHLIEQLEAHRPEVVVGVTDTPRDETVYLVQDPRLHVRIPKIRGGVSHARTWPR